MKKPKRGRSRAGARRAKPSAGGNEAPRRFSTKRLKTISLTLLAQLNDLYHIDVKADNARPDSMLLPRIATVLNNARSHLGKERVVLCVAGDFLAPSCLSKHFFGEHMVDVLNALDTRFVSLGNHEFDIPAAEFTKRIKESNFTWLSSNFRFSDDAMDSFDNVQPAALVDLAEGARLCLFGVLYPSVYEGFGIAIDPISDIRALIGRFEGPPSDRADRLQSLGHYWTRMAERFAKGDFGHIGRAAYAALTHQDTEGDRRLAQGVPERVALLGGHEHEVLNRDNLFGCMIAKGLSNARTLRLNWLAAVDVADLQKIEGFGQDPQVLIDIAQEIYLESIVPETQRLFIAALSTRTAEELDALKETVLSYFRPAEQVSEGDGGQLDAGGLIDLLSGHNYFVRMVNRHFVFAYSLALHAQRPEFIDVVPEDARMREVIDKWLEKSPEPLTPVLLSPVEFEVEDGAVRKRSTNFGNFAADIVRGSRNRRNAPRPRSDIGLINAGSFRLDRNVDRGEPINRKLLCDIFYHNNKVKEFEISGKTIREILGASARLGLTDEGHGDFLQISGLRATVSGGGLSRVEWLDASGNWTALEDGGVYRVATTHYVAKICADYSRFFEGSDGAEVELEIRSAVYDEFAALAQCADHERDAYFSDLMSSEIRWNFA